MREGNRGCWYSCSKKRKTSVKAGRRLYGRDADPCAELRGLWDLWKNPRRAGKRTPWSRARRKPVTRGRKPSIEPAQVRE